MLWFKNNSSINMYNTNNNKMRKSIFLMRQKILVCFLRLTVPIIAVHLENANAKFQKLM